jgi:hypothetical protein
MRIGRTLYLYWVRNTAVSISTEMPKRLSWAGTQVPLPSTCYSLLAVVVQYLSTTLPT